MYQAVSLSLNLLLSHSLWCWVVDKRHLYVKNLLSTRTFEIAGFFVSKAVLKATAL